MSDIARGGPCQYEVLLSVMGIEVHATYCPFLDGFWCVHLTIVDHNSGDRWNYGWIRNSAGKRVWRGLSNRNPDWVNEIFQIYAWHLLGNDFKCQRSIYDF